MNNLRELCCHSYINATPVKPVRITGAEWGLVEHRKCFPFMYTAVPINASLKLPGITHMQTSIQYFQIHKEQKKFFFAPLAVWTVSNFFS